MVIDTRPALKGSILLFVLSTLLACLSASAIQEPPPFWKSGTSHERTDYERWVTNYARKDLTKMVASDGTAQLKLVITALEGEESVQSADVFRTSILRFVTELSTSGQVRGFTYSYMSTKGSSGTPIPAADLKRLDKLLARLPEDGFHLPPPGRRMLLQAVSGQRLVTRVYDLANTPDIVWEILRLSGCAMNSWVPKFKSQSVIDTRVSQFDGFCALSPSGREILYAQANGPLQVWEPTTHELLAEIPLDYLGNRAAFSPDGSLVVIGNSPCICLETRTWSIIKKFPRFQRGKQEYILVPQFTHDGSHLLLQSSQYPLQIYDVRSWQQVDASPEVPEGATQYVPSNNGKRAVVRLQTGALVLWDTVGRRQIAVLDNNTYLSHVSFAPDDSQVAVSTAQIWGYLDFGGSPRVRIWKTKNGELLHELRPNIRMIDGGVDGLIWSPDGHYVLAAIYGTFTRNISVFSTKTGQHRGDFEDCGKVTGMALLPDGKQLVTGSEFGRIHFWDFETGLKSIKAFEASLAPLRD
ncbi:WD40 repeat domain-containing protein [Pedosphaera parvula]|uniref:WD-40 repeat protein n=1 Tax=Pedosphaera parvula (strain Ellin514) TaxID=320771 RepID=B9XAD0_PEDPL|nr:WD40 repeat domain-containing protein [Pedosphaera parvula]EEF63471.1 hypothetical protein Cflav_PD6106 [Pedosphaera parvula Ellin514]